MIGYVGDSGNATGCHLHYEVRDKNRTYGSNKSPNLDPHKFLPSKNAATKPAKPTISSADPDSDTQITVKWKAVNGATSYRVGLRRKDVKDYSDKTTTSTSYTFKNLTPGSTYYFRLYAVNKKGDSDRSATYMTYTMPSPPEQPTITCDSETQLTISWKKVSGASKYEIEYHKATDKDWKSLAKNLTGTSFTHTGLNEATKYNYRVRAIREGELGPDGNRKNKQIKSKYSKTKTKFTRLPSPGNTVDNNNVNHVVIKEWSAAKGDGKYTYSIVRKAPNEGGFKEVGRTTARTYTDTTGTPGTIYAYQIKILNQNSDGSFSTVGGTSTFYAGPKITKEIVLTPLNATSMQISWEKPITETGLTYTVQKWSDSKNDYEPYATTNNTYFVDNNLATGGTYRYYIQVRDSAGKYLTSTFGKSAVLEIPPTGIVLDKTALTMKTGETVMLNAVVTPDNSTNKSLTWTSSNGAIASVSNGTVTATGVGEADIYASAVNGKKAVCHVVVSPKECVHTYGDWIITKEATCETEGEQHRICSQCHQAEEKAPIPAKGHSYDGEWTVIKNAGCIEDGMKAHVCTVCGKNADETVIEATGHEFDENWQVEKAGNCRDEGIEYRTCKKCGERETRTTDTTAHEYELTKETETTPDGPGYKTYTCKICGDSYSEENVPEIVEGTIEIGAGAPKAGGLVTLPVTISENPGIAGFAFTVRYDKSALTPKTITRGKLLSSGTFTSNLEQGIPASELEEVAVYWGDSQNMTENGELFNITFDVSGEVPDGVYAVTLDYEKGDVTDQDFNDVMPNIIDNLITVADVIKGDVNQDRIVDSQDGLLLSRYIAKWKIDLNDNQLTAANVFNDTKVNAKDGVRLSQILAGYEMSEAEGVSLMSTNEVKLAMEEIEAGAGEIVTVPVTISDNEGIAGFNFRLDYDRNYLTPISVTKGELLLDGSFTTNLTEETDGEELEYITAYWNSADNMYDDGELFVVEFMVKDTAEVGEKLPLTLSYEDDDLCDYYLNDVSGVTTQGAVMVVDTNEVIDTTNPYYINNAYLCAADDNVCESIPEDGDFYVIVELLKTNENVPPANVIVAVYGEDGSLATVKHNNVTEEIFEEGMCSVYIPQCTEKIGEVKVFVWGDGDNITPLAKGISITD